MSTTYNKSDMNCEQQVYTQSENAATHIITATVTATVSLIHTGLQGATGGYTGLHIFHRQKTKDNSRTLWTLSIIR
jgi:Cu/Zn superoxide dismutase